MNNADNSLRVVGIYLILIPGMGLIFMPEFLLDLFQISYGPILWPLRMVGILAAIIGAYSLVFVHLKIRAIYSYSVGFRFLAAAFMISLWAAKQVEITITLFAAIDILGATWTFLAIRNMDEKADG